MKPSLFLLLAVLCCGCASKHTGTAAIRMEKQAAPPRNQRTETAAVEMENQAGPPMVLRPLTPSEDKAEFELLKKQFAQGAGPIADYDAKLRKRIDERWYELVEKYSYPPPRAGTVIVEFRLQHDGFVRECRVTKNDVEEWGEVCREAVEKASPFGLWPSEMRRLFGLNPREVRFTFNFSRQEVQQRHDKK